MATKKELLEELKTLKALQLSLETKQSPKVNDDPGMGTFGGIVARDNVENTEKYDTRYTLLHFIGNDGAKLAQVRGNEDAEEALALVKAITYGTQGKGGARWSKAHKAWSVQESEIPANVRALFVTIGTKQISGKYTA